MGRFAGILTSTMYTFSNGDACLKDLKSHQQLGILTPGVLLCLTGSGLAESSAKPEQKNLPIPRLEVIETLKEKTLNAAKITLKRRYYKIDASTIWAEPKVIASSDNLTFRYDSMDTPSEPTKMRIDIVITNAGKVVRTLGQEVYR